MVAVLMVAEVPTSSIFRVEAWDLQGKMVWIQETWTKTEAKGQPVEIELGWLILYQVAFQVDMPS